MRTAVASPPSSFKELGIVDMLDGYGRGVRKKRHVLFVGYY
jgi:hypothetical protein